MSNVKALIRESSFLPNIIVSKNKTRENLVKIETSLDQ